MQKSLVVVLALALAAGTGFAAPLDGAKLAVQGATGDRQVTVSVACEASAGGKVSVENTATGAVYPATLRDGELCFVAEDIPEAGALCVVRVGEESGEARVSLKQQDGREAVDVLIDGEHVTTYHYSNDWKKPFLWPVKGEGGVGLTRDYPMAEIPQKKEQDHPHHKSLYTAYGEVNGWDLWAEGENSGFQHSGEVTWGSGDAYGWVQAKNVWQDKDHNPVIAEDREYRFYATEDAARFIDVKVTLRADYGEVALTDTKEGGLVAVRMRPELSRENGHITNAFGDTGESECWGKPSPWCDYAGEMEGVGWRGITVFDNPENLRHPTSWHVRSYGLMGANCFGYSYFNDKDYNKDLVPENGDYTIKAGDSLVMHYRVYIHSGDVKDGAVAEHYADYAKAPEARWVD